MSMRLTVIGCSGSLPGPSSAASCYLVQTATTTLALDLGSGSLGPLQQHIALRELDAVLLSHLHADHCLDLCGLYVDRRYGPDADGTQLPVWGPAQARDHLAHAYGLPAETGIAEVMDFLAYPDEPTPADEPFLVGDIAVRVVRVEHPVPAYALRLEHGGRSLVYSGDTAPSAALVALATDADVLLSEAAFLDGADNPPGLHLTGREAGQHAADADVRRLVITHVPPWHEPQRAVTAAGQTYAGPIDLAVPGLAFDV